MKSKLIAIILSMTVLGGVGTTVYNTANNTKVAESSKEAYLETVEIPVENSTSKEEDTNLNKSIENLEANSTSTSENTSNDNNNVESKVAEASITQEANTTSNANHNAESNEEVERDCVKENYSANNNCGQDNSNQNKPINPVPPTVETPQAPPAQNQTPSTPTVDSNFMAEVESMIFTKVNEERAKAGVATLSYNSTMEKYARIKSQDMGDNNYFSHTDLSGNLITAKMQNDGVSYSAWGENIAYISGVTDANALATQFMTNWMNSQGHRENILSTNFSGIGVGVYKIGNKVYATQEFYR